MRDSAMLHAFQLKKALDNAAGGNANFIFLGDLNTMGVDDPIPYWKELDRSAQAEVKRIGEWAVKRKMMLLLSM